MVELVDEVQDARVSREAGAESDHAFWPQASKVCFKLVSKRVVGVSPSGGIGRHATLRG